MEGNGNRSSGTLQFQRVEGIRIAALRAFDKFGFGHGNTSNSGTVFSLQRMQEKPSPLTQSFRGAFSRSRYRPSFDQLRGQFRLKDNGGLVSRRRSTYRAVVVVMHARGM
jgi:hypothetical protein